MTICAHTWHRSMGRTQRNSSNVNLLLENALSRNAEALVKKIALKDAALKDIASMKVELEAAPAREAKLNVLLSSETVSVSEYVDSENTGAIACADQEPDPQETSPQDGISRDDVSRQDSERGHKQDALITKLLVRVPIYGSRCPKGNYGSKVHGPSHYKLHGHRRRVDQSRLAFQWS